VIVPDHAERVLYTEKQVEWARRRLAEIRGGRGDGFYPGSFPWVGFLFEGLFHGWLRRRDIPHVWNGGNEGRADFEIGSVGVALKSRTVDMERRRNAPRVLFPKKQEIPEAVVAGVVDVSGSFEAWICGAIEGPRFLRRAVQVSAGSEYEPGRRAHADLYVLDPGELRSIVSWLQDVYVSELQFA
jgi:hypothetical protein